MSTNEDRNQPIRRLFGSRLRRAAALTLIGSLAAISMVACGRPLGFRLEAAPRKPRRTCSALGRIRL